MRSSSVTSVLLAFLGSLIFASCELATLENPDAFEASFPATIEEVNEFLHSNQEKTWNAQTFTLAGLEGFQNCRLDDTMILSADGTYRYDGGTILCGAEDSQRTKTGSWKILNGGRRILFDEGTSNAYSAEVVSLESKKIILKGTYFGLEISGSYVSN